MSAYTAMKARHQKEIDAFPFFFAFNNQQFDEGMRSFGLNPGDTDKIYKLGSTGGFYRRTDSERLFEMFFRQAQELSTAIENDATGDGFIYEMFNYELANHEYIVSGNVSSTLDALGYTFDEINKNKKLLHGLKKAIKAQRSDDYA